MSEQNYKTLWNEAVRQVRESYKQKGMENDFNIWFKMDYVEDTPTEITVAVRNEFMWNSMVSKKYVDEIQDKIDDLMGQHISIKHIITPAETQTEPQTKPSSQGVSAVSPLSSSSSLSSPSSNEDFSRRIPDSATEPAAEEVLAIKRKHPQLNEDFTFEKFVLGDNSSFAYNASLAVAKNPGRQYNPLLIYGGVGLGKTHLMEAIGNYIYARKGDSVKICYISAENFTNEFTSAIGNRTTEKFKSKYRKLDVFLLDDIHFLIGKEGTQEELFHTFEALKQHNAQMVFTCDRPITELKGIEERLNSRFNSGLCIDLQPPNFETRRAILQKKIMSRGKTDLPDIPPEVVDYIAKNVQSNVRELEGCLNKIMSYAEITRSPLTIDVVKKELRDNFSQPVNGSVTIETIQRVVADHYNISFSDIKSKKRNKKFVIPRQIAIYLARKLLDYSYPELGNEFGGRDHTTMMHSYEKVEDQLKTDSSMDSMIQMLIREVKDYKK